MMIVIWINDDSHLVENEYSSCKDNVVNHAWGKQKGYEDINERDRERERQH